MHLVAGIENQFSTYHRRSRHANYLRVEDISFRCSQCGRGYKFKQSLLKHLRFECSGQKKFVCEICHRSFTQNVSLRRHMMRNHNVYQPPGIPGVRGSRRSCN